MSSAQICFRETNIVVKNICFKDTKMQDIYVSIAQLSNWTWRASAEKKKHGEQLIVFT